MAAGTRSPFGPAPDRLAVGRGGRCLLGDRALPRSHLPAWGVLASGGAAARVPLCRSWPRGAASRARVTSVPDLAPGGCATCGPEACACSGRVFSCRSSCGGPGRTYWAMRARCQQCTDLGKRGIGAGQAPGWCDTGVGGVRPPGGAIVPPMGRVAPFRPRRRHRFEASRRGTVLVRSPGVSCARAVRGCCRSCTRTRPHHASGLPPLPHRRGASKGAGIEPRPDGARPLRVAEDRDGGWPRGGSG